MDKLMVNCFCCANELETEYSDNPLVNYPVYGGLIFRANGNFGSTVFDPITEDKRLIIYVCDECVVNNIDKVDLIYDIENKTKAKQKPFNPEED